MPSEESSVSGDTFLDRWGHWVLWMGPYILIVSLLAWTPRLVFLLIGAEVQYFLWHVRKQHPQHPLMILDQFFLETALILVTVLGGALYPFSLQCWILLFCQMGFSYAIHREVHTPPGERPIVPMAILMSAMMSLLMIVFMITSGDVPGLPLLRAFLL